MALLDQEFSRSGFKLLFDQLEFPFSKAEALRVFLEIGVGIGKEHFGGGLLDNCAADGALQHVASALGSEAHDTVQLAPGFRSVFGEIFKCWVRKQAPKLIHPAD